MKKFRQVKQQFMRKQTSSECSKSQSDLTSSQPPSGVNSPRRSDSQSNLALTTMEGSSAGVTNSQQARQLINQLEAIVGAEFLKSPKKVRKSVEAHQLLLQVLQLSKLGGELISENAEIYSALPRILERCVATIDSATLLEDGQTREWALTVTDIVANYSDHCEFFSRTLAAEVQGLIKWMLEIVSSKAIQGSIASKSSKEIAELITNCLMSLHNVTKYPETRPVFKKFDSLNSVKFYLTCDHDILQCLAMIFTARVVEENESVRLAEEFRVASAFVKVLTSALESSDRANLPGELSATEVVDGMRLLLITDANKAKFVEEGILPLLGKMLASSEDDEKMASLQCLWTLAFVDEVRQQICESEDILDTLETISEIAEDKQMRIKASNALIFIKNGRNGMKRGVHIPPSLSTVNSPTDSPRDGNGQADVEAALKEICEGEAAAAKTPMIFISYCQKQQPMVLRLRESLRQANFECWIDVEAMHGSTLQAMADAIERCTVALMCYSEDYKKSNNCRSEAEYIFQLRKPIVPVKMQKQYNPDGWLGIILGVRFYIDMSLASIPYVEAAQKLCAEITNQLHIINQRSAAKVSVPALVPVAQDGTEQKAATSPMLQKKAAAPFAAWSNRDVRKWLQDVTLDSAFLKMLDGNLLWTLFEMKQHAPQSYYAVLMSHFTPGDLHGLLSHLAALDRLWQTVEQS